MPETAPTTAELATAVEASFMDPLRSPHEKFTEATAYIAALPASSGSEAADSRIAWFRKRVAMLEDPKLRQSEIEYLHGQCAHAALEIGFYRGDLSYDWRH